MALGDYKLIRENSSGSFDEITFAASEGIFAFNSGKIPLILPSPYANIDQNYHVRRLGGGFAQSCIFEHDNKIGINTGSPAYGTVDVNAGTDTHPLAFNWYGNSIGNGNTYGRISNLNKAGGSLIALAESWNDTNTPFWIRRCGSQHAISPSQVDVWNHENAAIVFGTNNLERLRINASGSISVASFLGVGVANADVPLHVVREGSGSIFAVDRYQSSEGGAALLCRKARGSFSSPAAPIDNDIVGGLYNQVWFDSAWRNNSTIRGLCDGNVTTGSSPGKLIFQTTPSGSTSLLDRMVIRHDGSVGIGTSNPLALFHVNGSSEFSGYSHFNDSVAIFSDINNNTSGFEYGNGLDPLSPNWDNFKFRVNSFLETPFLSWGVAQNLLLQSEAFDNATWVKTNIGTVTANSVIAPNAATTAEHIPAGSNDSANIAQTITNTTTGAFTAGVWARAQSGTCQIKIQLSTNNVSGTEKTINLTTAWQFFSVSETFMVAHSNKVFRITTGTNAVSLWGARLSQGLTPQIYRPTTSSALGTLTAGIWANSTIYGTLSGQASSSVYSNYGMLLGLTLSNTADKTNQWQYIGFTTITYNASYLGGHSWNFRILLQEVNNNESSVPNNLYDNVVLDLKGNHAPTATNALFNSTIPTFTVDVFGNGNLEAADVAALVFSTSTSAKVIRFYVRYKKPNTHYYITPINRYGSSYTTALASTTSYCTFTGVASQAMIATLPTPAQGSIVYGTQRSGSSAWEFNGNNIFNKSQRVGIGIEHPMSLLHAHQTADDAADFYISSARSSVGHIASFNLLNSVTNNYFRFVWRSYTQSSITSDEIIQTIYDSENDQWRQILRFRLKNRNLYIGESSQLTYFAAPLHGFGTDAPSEMVHVSGNVRATGFMAGADPGIDITTRCTLSEVVVKSGLIIDATPVTPVTDGEYDVSKKCIITVSGGIITGIYENN